MLTLKSLCVAVDVTQRNAVFLEEQRNTLQLILGSKVEAVKIKKYINMKGGRVAERR